MAAHGLGVMCRGPHSSCVTPPPSARTRVHTHTHTHTHTHAGTIHTLADVPVQEQNEILIKTDSIHLAVAMCTVLNAFHILTHITLNTHIPRKEVLLLFPCYR